MGKCRSKKQYRRLKKKEQVYPNNHAHYRGQEGTDPNSQIENYRNKLKNLAVAEDVPYPSGEYKCPHCLTCLICFRQTHGKKLHTDECNYECGHCPEGGCK